MQKGDYIRGIIAEKTDDIREKPIVTHDGMITGEHEKTFDVTNVEPVYDLAGHEIEAQYTTEEVFREGATYTPVPKYKEHLVDDMQEWLTARK